MNNPLDDFAIEKERSRSKTERFQKFEHALRFLLCELRDPTDREDDFLLNDIKQAVIVFGMKDAYGENNTTFLENMKFDFNNAIHKLETKHPDIDGRTFYIKLFMEDFYFNK